MDHPRSMGGDDNVGIPDDLRCKRSDGKQWRCTAMSMPDKTVCEKHYIQAKKRAANSAMRASMKKARRKSLGESDIYLESKSDDMDLPLSSQFGDYSGSVPGKKYKEKPSKNRVNHSPEMTSMRSFSTHNSVRSADDVDRDGSEYEESQRSPPPFAMESSRGRSRKVFDSSPMTESSDDNGEQPCHQCRRDDRDRVIWCLKCRRRGYCDSCIATWYSDIPVEEIERVCPACRGSCSCRVCLRGDNLIKARIRDIPAQDKLQYLYCVLSSVLPVVKQIHREQCSEVELEKKLRGNEIDLARTKLNADEQMCCNFCRTPIIDYHRHCTNCSYDLCLNCCKDIREASKFSFNGEMNQIAGGSSDNEMVSAQEKLSDVQLNSFERFSGWKANSDGSLPCAPKKYWGCGSSLLVLKRIFKMNWVAKLVKNVEEMVGGCKTCNSDSTEKNGFDLGLCQAAQRSNDSDNLLYNPSSEDIKNKGIGDFRMHWSRGEPIIIKEVCDISAMSIWDPMVVWRGIKETAEEKMKDDNRTVKAIDCSDWTEIDIEPREFIKGYFDGRIHENGWPQLLKLKDWPSPSASEEFLLYQRPDFISKLPLLEFIHSKWGLLNVAAKLPHYSLQNDVGLKIFISYGTVEELGQGDSTNNLHLNMRDMVFLLVHIHDVKLKDGRTTEIEKMQMAVIESDSKELCGSPEVHLDRGGSPKLSPSGNNGSEVKVDSDNQEKMVDQGIETNFTVEEEAVNHEDLNIVGGNTPENLEAGALWDVFRRQDVPKLIEYLSSHWKEFGNTDDAINDSVLWPLYTDAIYLDRHHKIKLKEEFGVEPWTFEQHLGEAIFIPAGCPVQVRHLQSTVQLGLDFLSPESLGEAVRLAEEIRGLPNDHEAKLQILEVGKISLYAASSAIKEVQKLVLEPKLGPELGFEDPNLTALVSQNLESMVKRRQITCI